MDIQKIDQIELQCGVTLELQPVKSMLLLDLLEGMKPGADGQFDIKSLSIRDLNRLMKYFCGWGVKNDVPRDQVDSVSIFGDGEHVQRAAWVRMIATETELAQVFAQVMALTQRKMTPQNSETQAQELERLRAENEQLKAQDGG